MAHSPTAAARTRGFTLLELMVVVALIALASATVALAMRDSAQTDLERDAARLSAWMEAARTHSRSSGQAVRWLALPEGFRFEGWPAHTEVQAWLGAGTQVEPLGPLLLGPEPIIEAQVLRLTLRQNAQTSLTVSSDGLRPFAVGTAP